MRTLELTINGDLDMKRVLMQIDQLILYLTIGEARQIALELVEKANAVAIAPWALTEA